MAAVLQLERHLRHQAMTRAWRGHRPAPAPQPVAPATPKLAQEVTPAALGQRASDWRRQEVLKQPTLQEPEQRRRSSRQAGKRGFMIVLCVGSQGSGENLGRLPASGAASGALPQLMKAGQHTVRPGGALPCIAEGDLCCC